MKISLRWLSDYVPHGLSSQELAEKMTAVGIEVESVERLGEGLDNVVVGQIMSIEPHPNAEKLTVSRVDVGGRTLQIVSGATNIYEGAKVPVALEGAVLPGGLEIKRTTLRGVDSEGMMCSEAELEVGPDESGIMILPQECKVGDALVEALQLRDDVIDFAIYPNRPDLLSVIGIAREVAAITNAPLQLPDSHLPEGTSKASELIEVEVEDKDLCPRYAARVIEGVTIGPSPEWMQRRLRAAGMRPINNVVDITNFVMLEWGQPLHAFDYDLLESKKIIVRRAKEGETIVTLDSVERNLSSDMLLITDGGKPVAIAGTMGGENSEVKPETKRILLESANFYGPSVRRTARKLGLRTESSQRFEKGLDPNLTIPAINRAAALMCELAGGVAAQGIVDAKARPVESWKITLRPRKIEEVLGLSIPVETAKSILRRLGLQVKEKDGALEVDVPTFRGDLQREIDLIEELARIYGYDQIPVTLPVSKAVRGGREKVVARLDQVRDALTAMGMTEAINYSFVSPKGFDLMKLPQDHPLRDAIEIVNPLNEEQSIMRTTLLPGMLQALARNSSRQVEDVSLFELGAVYHPKALPLKEQPREKATLALALMGTWPGAAWKRQEVTFFHLKGVLEGLAEALGLELDWRQAQHPSFHPGRCAEIVFDGKAIGVAGEIHPEVAGNYDLPGRVYLAEVTLPDLLEAVGKVKRYQRLSRFPAVTRDLALLTHREVPAERIRRVILENGGELVRGVELFDVYEGAQVPAGYRSLAFSITYMADRTLTDEEVNEVEQRIQTALVEELGVKLRT